MILLLLAQGDPPLFEPFMRALLEQPGFDADGELTRFVLEEAKGVTAKPFQEFLDAPPTPLPQEWRAGRMALGLLRRLLDAEPLKAALKSLPTGIIEAMGAGGIMDMGQVQAPGQIFPGSACPVSRNGGIELVVIPAGRFLMGSPPRTGDYYEHPQHSVNVKSFRLSRYPVTNAEYRLYLEDNPSAKEPRLRGDRHFNQDRQPVVGVDWEDARRFCEWAGGRLPTEAEWEYACRAETVTTFHWGDDEAQAAEFAWYRANSGRATHPVGEKQPNPWGLHDLTGNIWEWTQDVWHGNFGGALDDGSAWTEGGNGGRRVIRGGFWGYDPSFLGSTFRLGYTSDHRGPGLGFRLAQDLP